MKSSRNRSQFITWDLSSIPEIEFDVHEVNEFSKRDKSKIHNFQTLSFQIVPSSTFLKSIYVETTNCLLQISVGFPHTVSSNSPSVRKSGAINFKFFFSSQALKECSKVAMNDLKSQSSESHLSEMIENAVSPSLRCSFPNSEIDVSICLLSSSLSIENFFESSFYLVHCILPYAITGVSVALTLASIPLADIIVSSTIMLVQNSAKSVEIWVDPSVEEVLEFMKSENPPTIVTSAMMPTYADKSHVLSLYLQSGPSISEIETLKELQKCNIRMHAFVKEFLKNCANSEAVISEQKT